MTVIVLFTYQIPGFADSINNDFLDNELQQVLDSQVKKLGVPGIQAAMRIGHYNWSSTSGSVNNKKDKKLTDDHILRIGSVTKLYTAAIIMKLYEEGKIDLDDTIDEWFPDFPKSNKIKVRQLLNHSSGIYNYTESLWLGVQAVLFSKKIWDPYALLKTAEKKDFYFAPGRGHHYSNTNYLILGLIIEKITGKTLAEVYREYIIEPAKLNNTFFVPYEKAPENLISGFDHDVIPLGINEIAPDETSFATLGFSAGAMVSTADNLRRWTDYLFKSNFLSENTLKLMMEYIEAEDSDVRQQIGYGLGLRVIKVNESQIYGHTGTIPGFGAAAFYCPQQDYSIAIISNYSMFNQFSVIEKFVSVIEKYYEKKRGFYNDKN